MDYLIISILIGVFFIASIILGLILGLHYGQKLSRGETIEKPKLNPVKAIKQHQEDKKAEEEAKKLNDWINQMENYTGDVINK